jgi:hypothetical protein
LGGGNGGVESFEGDIDSKVSRTLQSLYLNIHNTVVGIPCQ